MRSPPFMLWHVSDPPPAESTSPRLSPVSWLAGLDRLYLWPYVYGGRPLSFAFRSFRSLHRLVQRNLGGDCTSRVAVPGTSPTDRFYLWPSGLRSWCLLQSALILLPLLSRYLSIALISFALINFAIPILLFGGMAPRALQGVFTRIPDSSAVFLRDLAKWRSLAIRQGGRFHAACLPRAFARRLAACLPLLDGWHGDAVCWYGRESVQGAVLTRALREVFGSDGHPETWRDRGFLHWLAYWCYPVWAGYLVLLGITGLHFLDWIELDRGRMVVALLLWTGLSIVFLHRQVKQRDHWLRLDDDRSLHQHGLPLDIDNRLQIYRPPPPFTWQSLAAILGAGMTLILNVWRIH